MSKSRPLQLSKQKQWLFLAAILVFTLLVYIPLFQNDFLKTWDDDRYVLENPHIKHLSLNSIINNFSIYYDGHYHPITLISLTIDHQLGKLNPRIYHGTNLLLHLFNVFLVFWFIQLLFKRKKPFVALFTALLFGIGTIHVESVAWASERKNVLFVVFFLASLISYLYYLQNKRLKFYFFSLGFFVLSVLSKSMAITLAVTLPLLDYFYQRKLTSRKVIFEKIPFFLIAALFGLVAIWAQQSTWGADLSQEHIPFVLRFLFGGYAFILYIVKTIFPFRLSGFYPYPSEPSGSFMFVSIITSILSVGFVILIVQLVRKKKRELAFPLLFFAVNIFLLLKIFEVPAGDYIMADRYAYLPSIGIYLFIGFGSERALQSREIVRKATSAIIIVYVLFIALLTFNRIPAWQDDERFYTDMIDKYPQAEVAYTNRGGLQKIRGNLQGALNDYNKAIKLGKYDYKAFANRASVYSDLGEYENALKDYEKALSFNQTDSQVLAGYGYAQLKTGDFTGAIRWFDRALQGKKGPPEIYGNRGTAKFNLSDFEGAIQDYSKATELDPKYVNAWFNRGLAYLNSGKLSEAIQDFSKAIEIMPGHADSWANMGIAWSRVGNMDQAFKCYDSALKINPNFSEAYLNRGIDRYYSGQLEEARKDLDKALLLNPGLAPAFYFRGLILQQTGEKNFCDDYKKALDLGFNKAEEKFNVNCK